MLFVAIQIKVNVRVGHKGIHFQHISEMCGQHNFRFTDVFN